MCEIDKTILYPLFWIEYDHAGERTHPGCYQEAPEHGKIIAMNVKYRFVWPTNGQIPMKSFENEPNDIMIIPADHSIFCNLFYEDGLLKLDRVIVKLFADFVIIYICWVIIQGSPTRLYLYYHPTANINGKLCHVLTNNLNLKSRT